MLKLIYDIECGFDEIYITEKDCEFELSGFTEAAGGTDEDYYAYLKDLSQEELEDEFDSNGILGMIEEMTELDYAHGYFNSICFKDPENPFVPACRKIYNFRVVYCPTTKKSLKPNSPVKDYLKAGEVMAILNITRQTLCHYVKRGLIKIDTNYTGGQYRYNRDSVMALLNK